MTTIKNKLKDLQNMRLPINSGTLALFISIMAIGFVATATNTPCLSAQSTCAVGGDNEFSGNISLKGNTSHSALLKVDPLLAGDIELTLPDQTGTLALETGALAGLKVMATDVSGEPTTTTVYPLSLTIDSPLKTDGSGNLTATDLDPETDLTIGTGLANQVLGVNSGATALTFTSITGVPTLTADKFVITDGTGALTTTNLLPLSFGANKPIVSDAAGNLTDVTLTADTPMKTDANGNTSASDLDITTDISTSGGTALQEIRVNSGGTALEYFTPSSGGVGAIIGSGAIIDFGNSNTNACFYNGTLPNTSPVLDPNKRYTFRLNWDNIRYNQAIANGGAPNIWFQIIYGDQNNNIGRGCDDYVNGAYGVADMRWNHTWDKQTDTCSGSYYRSNSHQPCQYNSSNSPNYWSDSFCVLGAGHMPASSYSAFDYLYFDQYEINFGSLYSGTKGTGITFTGGGGFSDVDTGNSEPKNTFAVAGSCTNFTNHDFENVVGFRLGMWNNSNQVWNEINWSLIEFN